MDSDEDGSLKVPWRRKDSQSSGKVKGLCDVCELPDGDSGLNLQKCADCGVCVHDQCYGIVHDNDEDEEDKKPKLIDWKCHPCSAVGKTFLVSKPHQAERRVTITTRPTKCYLCPVTAKSHAMNLLYDVWGRHGRPLVVKDSLGRDTAVAWVHTLCALVINSNSRTAGCVYGCDEYGQYENFDITPNEDNYMDNDDGANFSNRLDDVIYIPHHFVQCNDNDPEHAFILKDTRKSNLKCDVCGIAAQTGHYFPIQCIANDEHEFKAFQKKHKNTMECTVAFHVGCARWSSDSRRIYFRPENDRDNLRVGGYCSLHASNLSGDFKMTQKHSAKDGNAAHSSKGVAKRSESTSTHHTLKKKRSSVNSKVDHKSVSDEYENGHFLNTMKADAEKQISKARELHRSTVEALSRLKMKWSARAVAQNIKGFAKLWALVEERLNALYPKMRLNSSEHKNPKLNTASEQKGPSVAKSSLEQKHPDVMLAFTANPWSLLWYPTYVQGACNIEDWDTMEEISPPSPQNGQDLNK